MTPGSIEPSVAWPPQKSFPVFARLGDESAGPTSSPLEKHLSSGFYDLADYADDFDTLPRALGRVAHLQLDDAWGGDTIRELIGQIESSLRRIPAWTRPSRHAESAALSVRVGTGEAGSPPRAQQLARIQLAIAALGHPGLQELSARMDGLESALAHYAFRAHELVDRNLRDGIAQTAARLRYLARSPPPST